MHSGDDVPQVPRWFAGEVVALFALYPNATVSQATVPAWWRVLHAIPPAAVVEGLRRAAESSPTFVPSALIVREHARSAAKSGHGSPRPNFELRALPEPDPELPQDHPMWAELEGIKARQKSGELQGVDVMRAVVNAVVGQR